MIMLLAETETQNILHLVQGPETDLHFAVHGNLVLNISSLLAQMNGDKPVLLHFTKCASESEHSAQLAALTARGAVYPFNASTMVFGPKGALEAAVQQSEAAKKAAAVKEEKGAPVLGKCVRCGSDEHKELVPGIEPGICYSCAKIDLGLAKTRPRKVAAEKT